MGGISVTMLFALLILMAFATWQIRLRRARSGVIRQGLATDTIFAVRQLGGSLPVLAEEEPPWPAVFGIILLVIAAGLFRPTLTSVFLGQYESIAAGAAIWSLMPSLIVVGALAAGLLVDRSRVPPVTILWIAALGGGLAALLVLLDLCPPTVGVAATSFTEGCVIAAALLVLSASGLGRPLAVAAVLFALHSALGNMAVEALTSALVPEREPLDYELVRRARNAIPALLAFGLVLALFASLLLRKLPVRSPDASAQPIGEQLGDPDLWLMTAIIFAGSVATASALRSLYSVSYSEAGGIWMMLPYARIASLVAGALLCERTAMSTISVALLALGGGGVVLGWSLFAGPSPANSLASYTLLAVGHVPIITHLLDRWHSRGFSIAILVAVRILAITVPGTALGLLSLEADNGGYTVLAAASAVATVLLLLVYRRR